jgi:hypothetical protein
MKRGDRVNVSEEARKAYAPGWGNDQFSGNVALKAGDILYHSSSKPIKTFATGFTCFYINDYFGEYVYAMKIKKDTVMRSWNAGEEVRVDLEEGMEIIYVGKCTTKINYDKREEYTDRHGRKDTRWVTTKIDNTIRI